MIKDKDVRRLSTPSVGELVGGSTVVRCKVALTICAYGVLGAQPERSFSNSSNAANAGVDRRMYCAAAALTAGAGCSVKESSRTTVGATVLWFTDIHWEYSAASAGASAVELTVRW